MANLKLENVGKRSAWVYPEIQGANPSERWGHSACFSQGLVYVFGGCRGGLHFSDVMSLDLTTMAWSTFACTGQQPGTRDSHTAVLHGRKMIVFGGTNGSKKINDVHILDLDSHVWSSPAVDGQPPPPRESHSATVVDGNKMVIFGGTGEGEGNYLNDIHFLELDRMKWVSPAVKGDLPVCRDSHTSVAVKDQLIMYGGDCGDRYLSEVDVFSLKTFTWSKIDTAGSPQPAVRAGHVSVAVANKMYIFGGVGDRAYYNDVWALDTESRKWSQIEVAGHQPQGRFSHVAVLRDDDVAIYGDCGEDEKPLDEVLVLHLGVEQLNPDYPKCKFIQTVYDMERRKPAVEVINDDGICDGEPVRKSNWKNDFLKLSNQKGSLSLSMPKEAFGIRSRARKLPFSHMGHLESEIHAKKMKTSNLMGRLEGTESEHDEISPTMSQQPSPTISEQDKTCPTPPASKPLRPPAIFLQHQQDQTRNLKDQMQKAAAVRIPTLQLQLHLPGGHQPVALPVHDNLLKSSTPQPSPRSASPVTTPVGSEVRGIIDGAFDSGYLMTAQVNGQVFRGVLFSPGPMHAAVHRPPPCNSHTKIVAPSSTTSMAPHHVTATAVNAGTIVGYPVYISPDSTNRVTISDRQAGGFIISPEGLSAAAAARQLMGGLPAVVAGQSGRWIFQPSSSANSSPRHTLLNSQQSVQLQQEKISSLNLAAAAAALQNHQQQHVSQPPSMERSLKKSLTPSNESSDSQPAVTLSLGSMRQP